MLIITVSTILLFMNAVWDFACSVATIVHLAAHRCECLAYAHLALWVDEIDRVNRAAAVLTSALLMQWAFVRMRGALSGPASYEACVDAPFTYVVEAVLVGAELFFGRMHTMGASLVILGCAVCLSLIFRECGMTAVSGA